ncbi:MAG TPA: hypothetical protein VNO70_12250 [Blastocatellia bacterium]|nr:hypothetical protein [Blastocatellia bacterium]
MRLKDDLALIRSQEIVERAVAGWKFHRYDAARAIAKLPNLPSLHLSPLPLNHGKSIVFQRTGKEAAKD